MATPFNPRGPFAASKQSSSSDEAERLVSAGVLDDDAQFELKLRPQRALSRYAKENLGARSRQIPRRST